MWKIVFCLAYFLSMTLPPELSNFCEIYWESSHLQRKILTASFDLSRLGHFSLNVDVDFDREIFLIFLLLSISIHLIEPTWGV